MSRKTYIWEDAWDGYYGPICVMVTGMSLADANRAAAKALRRNFKGYKLGRLRKLGPPTVATSKPHCLLTAIEE